MSFQILRDATRLLVAENPTTIVIKREARTPNAGGGDTVVVVILPPVVVRIVPTKRQNVIRQDESGMFRLTHWVLLSAWDADIRVGDMFTIQSLNFRVEQVTSRRLLGEVVAKHYTLEEVV